MEIDSSSIGPVQLYSKVFLVPVYRPSYFLNFLGQMHQQTGKQVRFQLWGFVYQQTFVDKAIKNLKLNEKMIMMMMMINLIYLI